MEAYSICNPLFFFSWNFKIKNEKKPVFILSHMHDYDI